MTNGVSTSLFGLCRLLYILGNRDLTLGDGNRFLLTRFWFAISIGGGNSEAWLRATIMNTQEVVPGEVWSVSFLPFDSNGRHFTDLVTVYILESTCEVIGNALPTVPRSSDSEDKSQSVTQLPLRADWSSYLQPAAHASGSKTPSLLSQLKWAHQEEYERGISRVWLARITKEEEVGAEKQRVAERYVMACVVANRCVVTFVVIVFQYSQYSVYVVSAVLGCQPRRWPKSTQVYRIGMVFRQVRVVREKESICSYLRKCALPRLRNRP